MGYRKFKPEFKRRVVEEWVSGGKRIAELEAALGRATREVDFLKRALRSRIVQPGLIHHSDQGVQYASESYVRRVREAGLTLSMGRRGQPTDSPRAEAFFRTLKMEQVYLTEYLGFEDAYRQIRRFIEHVYNRKRLHLSLGYLPPVGFEEKLRAKPNRRSAPVGRPSAPLTRSSVAPAVT